MGVSRKTASFIRSLQRKKYRRLEKCFVVEGAKSIRELLRSDFEVVMLLGTSGFLDALEPSAPYEVVVVSEKELESLGEFQTNQSALAVARIRPNTPLTVDASEYALLLDEIHDPGNLGTIIRTADWYGISKIMVSPETADFYNPKVISSTMGSFTRVNIFYTDLAAYIRSASLPVYGAFLDGADVHTTSFSRGGLILIGSESRGISAELESLVTARVTIPRYGEAESLNAALATAVICDNMRRLRPQGADR